MADDRKTAASGSEPLAMGRNRALGSASFAFILPPGPATVKQSLVARMRWHSDRLALLGRWLAGLDAGLIDPETVSALLRRGEL
jgi:hypothetical protein